MKIIKSTVLNKRFGGGGANELKEVVMKKFRY